MQISCFKLQCSFGSTWIVSQAVQSVSFSFYEGETIYKSQMSVCTLCVHCLSADRNMCMLVEVVLYRLDTRSVSGRQSTMTGVLHECTRGEQRAVVRFLLAKGLFTEVVHREMHPVYGDNCFSRKTMFNWIQEFNKGRQSIRNESVLVILWRCQLKPQCSVWNKSFVMIHR